MAYLVSRKLSFLLNSTARKIEKELDCTVKSSGLEKGFDDTAEHKLISEKTGGSIDDIIYPEIQAAGNRNPPLKKAYKWKSVNNSPYLK